MTSSITLPAPLLQRAQQWAQQRGESTPDLIEDALETYLEELEDRGRMEQALSRIKAGEAALSWESYQAIQDPEEQDDILAILAAKEAVIQGEDSFVSLAEVERDLGISS